MTSPTSSFSSSPSSSWSSSSPLASSSSSSMASRSSSASTPADSFCSPPTHTQQWILSNKPHSLPSLSGPSPTFTQRSVALPALAANQVLLRTLYLSNDPAQRGWISAVIPADRLYVPPVQLDSPMRAYGIAQVITSTCRALPEGALVTAVTGWVEWSVHDARGVQRLPEQRTLPVGVRVTHFLGALGPTGLTAYCGLVEIAKVSAADTVVISAAAGATGSMAVQIAKHMLGCRRVVGIAGGPEKCRWVVERLGADACVDYKADDFGRRLVAATEGLVEVYFDNVGGEILDLMLGRMKKGGRVVACGSISNYNREREPKGLANWGEVISNRLEIRGFICLDYLSKAREVAALLMKEIEAGRIKVGDENETVVEATFEEIPKTWMKLFEGANTGKLVTKLM